MHPLASLQWLWNQLVENQPHTVYVRFRFNNTNGSLTWPGLTCFLFRPFFELQSIEHCFFVTGKVTQGGLPNILPRTHVTLTLIGNTDTML